MSDARVTRVARASRGFNREQDERLAYGITAPLHKSESSRGGTGPDLVGQVNGSSSRVLSIAHGDSRVYASRGVLGRRLHPNHAMQHTSTPTTLDWTRSHKRTASAFTQYTKLCALHKAQTGSLVQGEEVVA